jgi:hypothetical protein
VVVILTGWAVIVNVVAVEVPVGLVTTTKAVPGDTTRLAGTAT